MSVFQLLSWEWDCLKPSSSLHITLEAHFKAKLAFMVAEVVELWEVSGHVSGCTTCMLKVTYRLGRFILVLIPSLLHSVLFDYCCCCLVAKSCLTLL